MLESPIETQFHEWYEKYSHQIYSYILVLIGEPDQAKDLMQETFVKAFRSMSNYRGDASPKTWLFRIARNVTIDYQRKKNPYIYMVDSFWKVQSNRSSTPVEIMELGEEIQELYAALSKLKKEYREVIILRKIKEFSISETATILDWKESRVRTMLHRGIGALRTQLMKEGYRSEKING